MSAEKRKCKRSEILLTVEFKEPGRNSGHSLGLTRNFSPEGLSFDSQNYHIGPGEVLECTLRHHDSDWSAAIRGEVLWKKESWYKCITGLKFIDVDDEFKNKILEFISLNEKAPERPMGTRGDEVSQGVTAGDSTSRKAEPAIAGAAGDIPHKEVVDKPKADETLSDDMKTISPVRKHARKAHDSRIRNIPPAPAPRTKTVRNVLLVVAAFAVISAGTLFFMFEMSKRSINVIPPSAPDAEDTSPVPTGANPETDDVQPQMPVPEQSPAAPAEDNAPENSNVYPEPPAVKPDEKRVVSEQPLHAPAVQPAGEETKQPPPEPPRPPRPDTADRHAENAVRINADGPPVAEVKKPEKTVRKIEPDVKQLPGPATEIKDTASKETAATQNGIPEDVPEDKMPAPSKDKIRTYEDPFDDNVNNWDIFTTSMASARIELGEYHIQNKRKRGAHVILHHADFPFDSDFALEVSMRLVKSSGYYSYGIVLGAIDALNNHTFQISAADSFSIRQYREGVARELRAGKIVSPVISQDSLNTLKVVKQGNTVRFYINDILVNEIPDLSFTGKKVGFLVDGESEIAVDRTRTRMLE